MSEWPRFGWMQFWGMGWGCVRLPVPEGPGMCGHSGSLCAYACPATAGQVVRVRIQVITLALQSNLGL